MRTVEQLQKLRGLPSAAHGRSGMCGCGGKVVAPSCLGLQECHRCQQVLAAHSKGVHYSLGPNWTVRQVCRCWRVQEWFRCVQEWNLWRWSHPPRLSLIRSRRAGPHAEALELRDTLHQDHCIASVLKHRPSWTASTPGKQHEVGVRFTCVNANV